MNKSQILSMLESVTDPEIPSVSIIDLGIITSVECTDEIIVTMTPTFVGCPAIDVMKSDIEKTLSILDQKVTVLVNFDEPWNSNRISEKGKIALKKFGLAPPPEYTTVLDLDILYNVACPYCNSKDTNLRNPFGPTLCRSIHYCNECMQAFEQFKPV